MPRLQSRAPFVRVATSSIHDDGVFAERAFDLLDVILEVDDAQLETRSTGDVVARHDAPERHINHSCEPNAFIKAIDGVHYVFALRGITAGEEVTIDYAINHDSADHVVIPCHCGSGHCRGDVQLGYFDLPTALQIAYLPLVEEWFVNRHPEHFTTLIQEVPAQ